MKDNWKISTIVVGVLVGALTGAGAAMLLIKKSESSNSTPKVSANQGIQVGLGVLGLLRMISGFGGE